MTIEGEIVKAVLNDLHGRKGVGDELDAIDVETYRQIKKDLEEVVSETIQKF